MNTCDTLVPALKKMFDDSKIASDLECQRNKASRILSDGLGPYCLEVIQNEIRNDAPCFTLEIDETTTVGFC